MGVVVIDDHSLYFNYMGAKKVSVKSQSQRIPIAGISNDWHLDDKNKEIIKDLITQQCTELKRLNIKIAFALGDLFHTRPGQKVEELVALDDILDIYKAHDIQLWAIPGNHDKQNLKSYKSFLQPYRHHSHFHYIDRAGGVPFVGVGYDIRVHLLPYFKEDMWVEEYKGLLEYLGPFEKSAKYVLLSHIAVNGSTNNDGTKVNCNIAVNDFCQWDAVLLGHYHNEQQIGSNVFHLPSLRQRDFGENDNKGFTLLYSDGTFETISLRFKKFEKIVVDIDQVNRKQFDQLVKDHASNESAFIRFEIIGSSDKVKAIDKEMLTALGIDVKMKIKEVEKTIEFATQEVTEYTCESITEEFRTFCKTKNRNFEEGNIYLQKKLNNG